jgi:glycosyltransferase involved in cell wall biosynthesis
VIDNLARGLRDRGHEVVLFTVGTSECPVERRSLFAQAVEPLGQSLPEAAHVLAAYESMHDVDLVHDHTVLGPLVAAGSGMRIPPVVATVHHAFTDVSRSIHRAVSRTASVVAISHDHARRAGDVAVAAVIHHGIDLQRHRAGPGGDDLVFVGRMSPDKGVAEAVRIAQLSGRALRIVSKMRDHDERAYFESVVRPLLGRCHEVEELGLDERVEVVGRAAALVNPIRWPEPFGLVMAESLAGGTPVLVRPEGAAPEIVDPGRTGWFFDDVASGVTAVAAVPHIDRAACRAEAEARFSLERMARDHEELYERVLTHRVVPFPRRGTVSPLAQPSGAARSAGPRTALPPRAGHDR